ncbi:heme biosynthesis HemY N-terminal domain-containing protein [Xinfangfangia sp. CPCC 101601]|uniref:Heme biosynthesis HemY N-terminal domain-containing protein n=1 Tax=Pseudogemmobacter lacusdianii TaxID=3069608 RepID=A0ABU0VU13_9RHOB|nr:heme biosynthesis HemY N-terminal domain-containing protein [Xinfangfangia sp. CPCC 101601]MDQ2065219.1 heme biosynthesis HemY N-terminal domain-containing protein [Xinfangfangia sp. CPCC 101601]
MLWSLTKVVLFLLAIGCLAVLGTMLSATGEAVRITALGMEFTLGPLQAVVGILLLFGLVWLGLRILAFLVATVRFLNGDETAISRYFDRNRERKGYAAMSEALIALASGESAAALQRAKTAEKLLRKPELTTLLLAQAAEANGDGRMAVNAYKSLLQNEQTRFAAMRGLLRNKLAEGDTDTALKLAEKAFAMKPRHAETQDILLKLQSDHRDWKGARITLGEKLRSGELPSSVYRRRDALLALEEAKVITDEGSTIEAREAAIEANKLSPDLIPAAVIAARALVEKGDAKSATRVLKKAWEVLPHPDLAAAFAAIEPEEAPAERLKRFKPLLQARPQDEETRLTKAELLLADTDFNGAREALGSLAEDHPTQRSLAILAAIERGSGGDDALVRGILAKAVAASRGPQWCCDKCQAVQEDWTPICPDCGGFDTLSWREPLHEGRKPAGVLARLAPFLFGQDRPKVIEAEEIAATSAVVAAVPASAPAHAPAPAGAKVPDAVVVDDAEVIDLPEGLTPDEILRRAN